jgi:hypothetical protein
VEIWLDVNQGVYTAWLSIIFQSERLSRPVYLSQIVIASVRLAGRSCLNKVWNRDRTQQPDDGDHNHNLDQREAGLTYYFCLHTVTIQAGVDQQRAGI